MGKLNALHPALIVIENPGEHLDASIYPANIIKISSSEDNINLFLNVLHNNTKQWVAIGGNEEGGVSIGELNGGIANGTTSDTELRNLITSLVSQEQTSRAAADTAISQAIETLDGRVDSVENNVTTVQSGLTTVQSGLSTAQSGLTSVQSSLSTVQSGLATAQSNISNLDSKLGSFDAAEWICTQTEQQPSEPQNLANFTSSNTYYSPLDVTYSGTGLSTANSTGANKTVQINLNGMNLVEGTSYKMKFVNTNYTLSGIMMSSNVISTETTEGGYTVLTWTHQNGVILSMLHPYNKSEASLTGITITPASASSGGNSQGVVSENPCLNPDKIKGLDFDCLGADLKEAVGGYNPTTYKGDEIRVFDSIICIGDSMTAGVFNKDTPGEYATIAKYSYPTYLGKMTGCDVTNDGVGGLTAGGWYNQCGILSGHDCAIIMLGINDAIQGTATSTFTEALGNIVDQLKLDSPGIKIFVATTPPATAYADSRYIPINTAIRTFVNGRNDCYLVDLQEYGHTADEAAYNKGHLSALGYRRLAEDFKNYISYIISQNLDDFDEVQFANSIVNEHIS